MIIAYKASQVVGVVCGLVAIIMISVGLGNLANPWMYTMLACLILTFWFRTHVHKNVCAYKGVTIRYVQERPRVWSSHICGHEHRFLWRAICRSVRNRMVKSKAISPEEQGDVRVRLFESKADRNKINRLSLEAFELMLGALQDQPGAVIISASVLNCLDRQPHRLQDRIDVVDSRSAWRYQLIHRKLSRRETLFGRWALRWPIRNVEGKHAIVPGIVVWRRQDPKPVFGELRISIPQM